jgi:hypothetical protein
VLELTECQNAAKTSAQRFIDKKKELADLAEREKAVQSEFSAVIGDKNKAERLLTRLFKKKIRRVKVNEEGDEESDDEDDENYMSSEGSGDEDEEEEVDESVCPPGVDESVFRRVLALREQRVDVEDALVEEKKAFELLKRETDSLGKKEKAIVAALALVDADLSSFQLEKQAKLNEIDVAIPLWLHQVLYIGECSSCHFFCPQYFLVCPSSVLPLFFPLHS